MLMMHAKRGDGDWALKEWPVEAVRSHIQFMRKLNGELRESGHFVGAEGLAPPGQARVVRAGTTGAPEVTDGPFAESKEFLAGYWIVDVASKDEAYAIAARASVAPGPDGKPLRIPIEVREVMSGPPVDP